MSPEVERHSPDIAPLRFPGTFAFIGSGCLLVLELVAGRILAPSIGVSLYTWTSIIGVVLGGLSLGNWLGGKLADSRPGRSTLSLLYLGGAAASALILVFAADLEAVDAPYSWPAILQVLWLSTLLFFVPSVLLGTVTPMIVKLSLSSLDATGRVVGRIQAAASLGSIVGVFATGFFLISAFGTRVIVAAVAITLLALALGSSPVWSTGRLLPAASPSRQWLVASLALGVLVFTLALAVVAKADCDRESNYYCIRVVPDETGQYEELALDLLVHGFVWLPDPTRLVYGYERLYEELVNAAYPRGTRVESFGIGGGTYSFPRYLEAHHRGHSLVAEIDREVTDTARERFGMKDSPGIEIIHDDARIVLRNRPAEERYDLILGDAFADVAIPYHLVTREFNELVASHLKPRGIYMINIVDGVDYDFLRSEIRTLKLTFPHVRLMTVPGDWPLSGGQATFVLVASRVPPPQVPSMLPEAAVEEFLAPDRGVVLSDDHVPVDQLMAPVFRQRLEQEGQEFEQDVEQGF